MDHLHLDVPVAKDFRTRLRGLAFREREDAGPGLLIPRCASVHTFGMRFALDVYFLDGEGAVIAARRAVPPRRILWQRGTSAVLEVPAEPEGESLPLPILRSACFPNEKR
ncbi:MAG TPA: DUF192 domain-containing protein [Solirubrobacterales bacterium]|nr:DUF192 domain-containing protein [Solirubrobacterales bacterium]